jgi:steroid delta-isomerase-like uncharacterized protein
MTNPAVAPTLRTVRIVWRQSKEDLMSEQNKQLVRRAVEEVWNKGNYDLAHEFLTSDFVVHGSTPADDVHGPEGVRQHFSMLRTAFPDLHFTVEDQIADGDRVVTRWTARGTHTGPFNGIPPTGNTGVVTGIDIDRIANGKLVECWMNLDELGLLQQLGVIPTPEPAVR